MGTYFLKPLKAPTHFIFEETNFWTKYYSQLPFYDYKKPWGSDLYNTSCESPDTWEICCFSELSVEVIWPCTMLFLKSTYYYIKQQSNVILCSWYTKYIQALDILTYENSIEKQNGKKKNPH